MFVPFPLSIAYKLLMAAYLMIGVAVLVGTLLLMLWPRARRAARRFAAGIVGSFPFVLFFQALSLPIIAAVMIVTFVLDIWSAAPNGPMLLVAEFVIALQIGIFLAASVAGGITGYGIGARMAAGTPFRPALAGSRLLSGLAAGLTRILPVSKAVTPAGAMAYGLCAVLFTVTGLVVVNTAYVQAYGSDEMDYRGEKIQLSKKYVDYDDYKNDRDNIAPSEIARVETMMTQARIGPDFADWKEFASQASQIKFPGYGMAGGPKVVAAGREFVVETIEIPRVEKHRYFVLEKQADGSLHLVDDFVIANHRPSGFAAISSIRLTDETLTYSDRSSNVVRETNLGAARR